MTPSGRSLSRTAALILLSTSLLGLWTVACAPVERPLDPAPIPPGTIEIQATPALLQPNWLLVTPSGQRITGQGDRTFAEVEPGLYILTWDPVGGWTSPRPNPVSLNLASGSVGTFSGTYATQPTPVSPIGTVVVDPAPRLLEAPWQLVGPNGFETTGTGYAYLTEREIGFYTVTWNGVSGWETPDPAQQTAVLAEGEVLTLASTYVESAATGTVIVEPERDGLATPWRLTGPNGYTTSGTQMVTLSGRPTGSYTVTWEDVDGWATPVPAQRTQTLESGGTIRFRGVYGRADAPQISTVSGTPAHGQQIDVDGSAFGTHTFDVEWTGAWIDAQPVGTNPATRPNWRHVLSSYANADSIVSRKAWSGSRSISTRVNPNIFQSTLQYLYPNNGTFRKIYATLWIYYNPLSVYPTTSNTQWKFIRINCNYTGPRLDAPGEIWPVNDQQGGMYWPMYVDPSGTIVRSFASTACVQDCSGTTNDECFSLGETIGYSSPQYLIGYITRGNGNPQTYAPTPRAWTRVEIYADSGTMDNFDGSLRITVVKPGQGTFTGMNVTGVKFLDSRVCRNPVTAWKTIIFQNYWADSVDPGPHNESANFYMDDMYLQFGTQARVEIGDQPVYEECTQREIQEPLDWGDQSLSFRLNRGGFAAGRTVYLFVVREDGVPSVGHSIVLE